MNIFLAVGLFIVGLVLVIYFAEKLVKGAVGTSVSFGISTFFISVVFIGFDPENLAVGAVGSFNEMAGIALGSIIGATMVAIALAFGITALIAPMTFKKTPKRILILPNLAILLLGLLALDGELSRIDGLILFLSFILSVIYLLWLNKKGYDIKPSHELSETIDSVKKEHRWKALGLLVLSLAAIIIGSEFIVMASKTMIRYLGLSGTFFGMIILAFLVSIEEIARELPAALQGRAEISFGNVVGSIFAFFLFNAGIIAMIKPVTFDKQTLMFYLPFCLLTMIVISLFMLTQRISRWMGGSLVFLYLIFVIGGYFLRNIQ
ncbi:sodium:calcium antiporter [Legionella oakridgensis]|uniref:Na/Ca antiporter n=1 Tax=Legionella oakridgensis TaxID=29423 RepID=A0A0W0X5K2_9GAMM|nr:sodium:calcium antiporter [Legionella oakridgensis]ETO93469.1 Ca2+/Na+ antiporter [Legionella oakridgensis RV-2-2007]KTD39855.1 Na/Ca antiporter [Legionella oakridgensis]STY19955.1 Ca2+/Na+ antiporter [Legionella longbeachae]